MTLVTVQNARIVTKEEIQDSESSASAGSCSQSGQRIFIEIANEKVQDMKDRYSSLNDMWDDDDTPPPSELPSIDLRSGNEDRQSPWDLNDQAYGEVDNHDFAIDIGRRSLCPIHADI